MARQDLAPRGVGHLLDEAISLYRANFKTVVAAIFAVLFPFALLYGLTQTFYYRGMTDIVSGLLQSGSAAEPPTMPPAVIIAYSLSQLAFWAYWLSQRYFEGTVLRSGPAMMTSRPPRLKQMLGEGLRAFPWVFAVSFLSFLAISVVMTVLFGIAFFALIASTAAVGAGAGGSAALVAALAVTVPLSLAGFVGAVAIAVYFSMAVPAVAIERCGVIDAFRRSIALVRRNFWRVVLVYAGVAILVAQMEAALTSPIIVRDVLFALQHPDTILAPMSAGWKVFEGLVGAGALVLVVPVYYFTTLALYLDLRARNEGLDLVVRAQELAAQRA